MNKFIKIGLIVVVAFFVLGVAKNGLMQTILTSTLSNVMHVPVKVRGVHLSFLKASIRIKKLQVFNPSGFPEKLMVLIPQIYIDFQPGAVFQGRAHFKEVTLELAELVVIKDAQGRLNVDAVKPTAQQKKESKQKAEQPTKTGKPPKLFIEKLSLSIGRVVYKDYSAGGEPTIQTFDVNIQNRVYENIDNPTAVVSLVMFEALTRTTLSRLVNLDVDAFKEGGIQALSKGLGIVSDGTDAAQNTAKQLLNLIN